MAKNTKYVSEATLFLRKILQEKPEWKEQQKQLRNTWWDRNAVDAEEQKTYKESSIPVHGYVYYE